MFWGRCIQSHIFQTFSQYHGTRVHVVLKYTCTRVPGTYYSYGQSVGGCVCVQAERLPLVARGTCILNSPLIRVCFAKAKVRHPFEGCGCRDGAIAPASESTVTPEHHLAAARAAVDEWHHRTNSPNVFAAVACAVSSAHPDGVAVQCLACPTFNGKDKAGEPRLYKFGPFGGNRANCRYDVGHFVSRRLRSTKHQQNWAAFFERTMRVLPRGEALPSARPAAPPPLTHLDVMRHTHAKDFEITSSTWLCRVVATKGPSTPAQLLALFFPTSRRRGATDYSRCGWLRVGARSFSSCPTR